MCTFILIMYTDTINRFRDVSVADQAIQIIIFLHLIVNLNHIQIWLEIFDSSG
jgi:hypothetical protein